MAEFEASHLETLSAGCNEVFAWVVLPNHYHALARTTSIHETLRLIGQLHGRSSHRWNQEEDTRGRKVFFRSAETAIKSERHFWASLIYVLNNPVKHNYVTRWQDWPYSNATQWLEATGRDRAKSLFQEYPIDDFGQNWDPVDF